jgi:hypothetical protein
MRTELPGEEVAKLERQFAMDANNLAWTQAEMPHLTDSQREQMMQAAHAAAYHWKRIGTALNVAKADCLLGLACARNGDGPSALHYARRSLGFITSHPSPDWEIAMGHAVLAFAAHVAGDAVLHAQERGVAETATRAIPRPKDKAVVERILSLVPVAPLIDR